MIKKNSDSTKQDEVCVINTINFLCTFLIIIINYYCLLRFIAD